MGDSKYNGTNTEPIPKVDGRSTRWESSGKNVTQTQVIKLQKIARSKIEAIGDFATGLAHELNQPMTFINSVFDYLSMKLENNSLDEAKAKELIQTAKSEIKRVSGVLDNLYEFGEGNVGAMSQVSMINIVEELLEIIEERMLNFSVEVSCTISKSLPNIFANQPEIKQGLMYLFENSLEALEESPEKHKQISISAEVSNDGRYVVIKFSNNGSCISNKHLDRIFEPFYTTKQSLHNSGLGLSILYSIVRNHNGTIRALPDIENGVVFEMTLPVFENV